MFTSSNKLITEGSVKLFDRLADKRLHVRRLFLVATRVIKITELKKHESNFEQLNLFVDYEEISKKRDRLKKELEKDDSLQKTILNIKSKYGKNMVLKGMDFEEGGTTIERNNQIGGHKA